MMDPTAPPPPSSFDNDANFYEESRWQKFKRRLFEEPLIPLGCALTCWALYEATKSIKAGDKNKTNRMFRRRIYAQGFTILAMVGGSAYWESDRSKRKEYDEALDIQERKRKKDAWIRELEIRDEEDQEFQRRRQALLRDRRGQPHDSTLPASPSSPDKRDNRPSIKSVLEPTETRFGSRILTEAMALWRK